MKTTSTLKTVQPTWWVGLVIVGVGLWIFRQPLLSEDVCALRDAGNFYYPLFAWQCSEWGAGRIPLWNAYDGLGVPALADATSCTFYPGKLIFALPIAFHLRFNLFIVGHVLFAAWSLFFVARRWGATAVAAGIGAMSYAYGGYVLFQYCNIVFLISAAWLPLAIWLAEATLSLRSPRRAAAFGGTLALMTLGGDPHTAYHAGLLTSLYALLLCAYEYRTGRRRAVSFWSLGRSRPFLLILAAGSALALSAMQVLPSWDWARRSDRSELDPALDVARPAIRPERDIDSRPVPRNDAAPGAVTQPDQGIFSTPQAGTHARRIYYFSLGPWRLVELFWPNVSGRMFPIHRRWLSALPGEGSVWTPTLYLGLVPLVAAGVAWRWSRMPLRDRWLICLVAAGIGGSLGWYGVGWVFHELQLQGPRRLAALPSLGEPVGGLYWLCVTLLPGYAYFRYPAKWFVFASLGFSLLAARGADRILRRDPGTSRCLKCLCVVSVVLVATMGIGRQAFHQSLVGAPPNDVYGPLDVEGAWWDVIAALLHMAAGTGLMGLVIQIARRRKCMAGASLLLLTAVDLVAANQWLVASVPHSIFESSSRAADLLQSTVPATPAQPPPRAIHDLSFSSAPSEWSRCSSERRVAEIVAWERHALLYKHPLPLQIAMLDAPATIMPAHWARRVHRLQSDLEGEPPFPDRPDAIIQRMELPDDPLGLRPEEGLQVTRRNSGPHVWFVADADAAAGSFPATCTLTEFSPQRIEIAVDVRTSGTLITKDLADPGWVAEIRTNGSSRAQIVPTIAVQEFFRGVPLQAGKSQVVLHYRPRLFYYGSTLTVVTLAVWGALIIRLKLRDFDRRPADQRRGTPSTS